MNKTKHDLDFGTLTLDYEELKKTSMIAIRYSFEALQKKLSKWHNLGEYPSELDAEWMLKDAEALAIATTTFCYLNKGYDREEVKISR